MDACVRLLKTVCADSEISVAFHQARSSIGYVAQHSNFVFCPSYEKSIRIGCEIQIRTVLEDGWARLSEKFGYKADHKKATNVRQLKKLASLKETSEEIADMLKL